MKEQNEQGPFKLELNKALLERYSCRAYLDQAIPPDST